LSLRQAARSSEAGTHPQYGKIVAIDHGNGLVSRYAHASEVYVNEGDLVVRGQKVAAVGTTGRSTGRTCTSRYA
jgi:murein DD-endopeptidase MepM/ murein hydrolase activator NlpD